MISLRDATPHDGAALAAIYNPYVADTVITFETEPVRAEEMAARVSEAQESKLPYLVAIDDTTSQVAGYAYASKWKGRCAYRHSVETSVYLDRKLCGQGIGTLLMEALIERLRAAGMHALIGGIALPNEGSVGLHERLGFKKVAQFEQVGHKFDQWIDVGYWQLILPET